MRAFLAPLLMAILAVPFLSASVSAEPPTATLKGRFIWKGDIPAPTYIATPKGRIRDESLLIGKSRGVANIAIWLRSDKLAGSKPSESRLKTPVVMEFKHGRLTPRVVGVVVGQKLTVRNRDTESLLLRISPSVVPGTIPDIMPGKDWTMSFPHAESFVAQVDSNNRPWVNGWVLIRPNRFFAITDTEGAFEITGLPAHKELEFVAWKEQGYIKELTVNDVGLTPKKGRIKLVLHPGENNLGDCVLGE